MRGDASELLLHYEGITLRVTEGREVVIDADPSSDPQVLQSLLLGPAMASVLHQRGVLAMHASAVVVDGGVHAFLGESGQGKSTIAAALAQRGCPVVADDLLAVGFDADGRPVVYPAFPHLRITADAARAVDMSHLSTSSRDRKERFLYRARGEPWGQLLPLRRIYILADGEFELRAMSTGAGFGAIAHHTYVTRALLEASSTTEAHLDRCGRVAATAPVAGLQRPRSLETMMQTAQRLERACVEEA